MDPRPLGYLLRPGADLTALLVLLQKPGALAGRGGYTRSDPDHAFRRPGNLPGYAMLLLDRDGQSQRITRCMRYADRVGRRLHGLSVRCRPVAGDRDPEVPG